MPKPVKKSVPKKSKRPSPDPVLRAKQLMDEHMRLADQVEAEIVTGDFETQYRARMSRLGKKGGKVGGARRMVTMTPERRSEVALKAARARWAKAAKKR
jgi:hypothetical protein